jgi:hypothetical protein
MTKPMLIAAAGLVLTVARSHAQAPAVAEAIR